MRFNLKFEGFNDMIKAFNEDFGIENTRDAVEYGLKKAGEYLQNKAQPFDDKYKNGKYSKQEMTQDFIKDESIDWESRYTAILKSGYNLKNGIRPPKGFHSIFVMYGTASRPQGKGFNKGIKQDIAFFNAVRGSETILKAQEILKDNMFKKITGD